MCSVQSLPPPAGASTGRLRYDEAALARLLPLVALDITRRIVSSFLDQKRQSNCHVATPYQGFRPSSYACALPCPGIGLS